MNTSMKKRVLALVATALVAQQSVSAFPCESYLSPAYNKVKNMIALLWNHKGKIALGTTAVATGVDAYTGKPGVTAKALELGKSGLDMVKPAASYVLDKGGKAVTYAKDTRVVQFAKTVATPVANATSYAATKTGEAAKYVVTPAVTMAKAHPYIAATAGVVGTTLVVGYGAYRMYDKNQNAKAQKQAEEVILGTGVTKAPEAYVNMVATGLRNGTVKFDKSGNLVDAESGNVIVKAKAVEAKPEEATSSWMPSFSKLDPRRFFKKSVNAEEIVKNAVETTTKLEAEAKKAVDAQAKLNDQQAADLQNKNDDNAALLRASLKKQQEEAEKLAAKKQKQEEQARLASVNDCEKAVRELATIFDSRTIVKVQNGSTSNELNAIETLVTKANKADITETFNAIKVLASQERTQGGVIPSRHTYVQQPAQLLAKLKSTYKVS